MRKFIVSTVVMLSVAAVATGGEYFASVSKFEGGKITFKAFDIATKGLGDAQTVKVDDKVKIVKGTINIAEQKLDAGEAYPGGKEAFAKAVKAAAEKKPDEGAAGGIGALLGGGVIAQVITDGEGDKEKVTEIRVVDLGGILGKGKKKG